MKSILFVLCILSVSVNSFAKTERHEHGAHVHGSGTLGIAFEELKGKLEFRIPSESIFGFEYKPKTDADKKTRADGLEKLGTSISEMVVFDASLKCVITKENIEVVPEKGHKNDSKHSETVASFGVTCEKSPLGSKIVFNFQKFFPRIKDLDVDVLAGSVQKSVEAKANGTVIEVK